MRGTMAVFLVCAGVSVGAQTSPPRPTPEGPPEFGPARGTLMIIGGGLRSEALLKQFIGLSGGPEASILLVPTAAEGDTPSDYWEFLQDLERAGARHVTVLHTRDRKVADSEVFAAPIKTAGGVFIMGGRHWRLADAYLNTRTHTELRGGIIAGTSAGATIQGSFLKRAKDPRADWRALAPSAPAPARPDTAVGRLARGQKQFDVAWERRAGE
jgi:cyanophycinase